MRRLARILVKALLGFSLVLAALPEAATADLHPPAADGIEAFEVSGEGATTIENIELPFAPARFILTTENKDETTFNLTGDLIDCTYGKDSPNVLVFNHSGEFTLSVDSSCKWSFRAEPIVAGGSITARGTGPYVGSLFNFDGPLVVKFTYSGGPSAFDVRLYHPYESDGIDRWAMDPIVYDLLWDSDDSGTVEQEIFPTRGRSEYLWFIDCEPHVEWEISIP